MIPTQGFASAASGFRTLNFGSGGSFGGTAFVTAWEFLTTMLTDLRLRYVDRAVVVGYRNALGITLEPKKLMSRANASPHRRKRVGWRIRLFDPLFTSSRRQPSL